MPIRNRIDRFIHFPLILVGTLVVVANAMRMGQAARDLPAYEELVRELEQDARAPGQPHAALDHARHALGYLQSRHAERWSWSGYMSMGTLGAALGVGLVAVGWRLRTV